MTYWGILTVAIGLLMLYWATTKSEFVVYRILCARSKSLWGENVHRFHQVGGIGIVVMGLLMTFKFFGN